MLYLYLVGDNNQDQDLQNMLWIVLPDILHKCYVTL